jgi:hypothetical protein
MSRTFIALFAATTLFAGACPALAGGEKLEVFYLGAPDCPYCAHWESQSRAALLASPEGKAVRFVEIRGETLRRPIEARHYPAEFQWVFQQVGPSRGVPRFLLAIDGKVVLSAFGTGGYERDFVPALKQAVRRRQEAK